MISRSYYLCGLIALTFVFFFSCAYLFFQTQPPITASLLPVVLFTNQSQIAPVPKLVETVSPPLPIIFTGDVLLARKVGRYMLAQGSMYPFTNVVSLFTEASAVIINFEAAVPIVHIPTPDFQTQFSVAANLLPVLREIGITHASLANNHSADFGLSGYQNTINELQLHSIVPFGHPAKVASSAVTVITQGHYQVGVIGIHTALNTPLKTEISNQLKLLSENSDIQIAYIHWGEEYSLVHNNVQAEFARELVKLGIDVIIGHHPHVTQDIQLVEGVPVFYSLGNFIFDQYFSRDVQEGYALKFILTPKTLEFELLPVSSVEKQSQPRQMNPVRKAEYLTELAMRSHPDLANNIKSGRVILPFPLATFSN